MQELMNLKFFNKIGSKFLNRNSNEKNKDDIFFNKKKEEQFKKNLMIKSLVCIFITNILTYTLMINDSTQENKPTSKIEGMISMSIALESYLPFDELNQYVKLVGPNNETITNVAILESLTEKEAQLEDRELPIYIVQLNKNDAQKIVQYQNKLIRAYPASIKDHTAKAVVNSGEPYEIKF